MLKKLYIENFASIYQPIELEFGRINLLVGDNGTGKTAVSKAIKILFDYGSVYSKGFNMFSGNRTIIQGYFHNKLNNEVYIKRIIERVNNDIYNDQLEVNNRIVNDFAYLSSQFIVLLHKTYRNYNDEFKTGIDLATFCINNLTGMYSEIKKEHFVLLNSLVKDINENTYRLIDSLNWEEDGSLLVKLWGENCKIDYTALSNGEQSLVCAEIYLSLSHMFSDYKNVFLIFDDFPTGVVGDLFDRLINRIESITKPNIQVLFTTWKDEVDTKIKPDCKIKIERLEEGPTQIFEITKRTPRGIKDIEGKIISKFNNNEDEFINTIVIPLLYRMSFINVKKVIHHGPGELGIDIGPFVGSGFEWRDIILGAQIKTYKLDSSSGSSKNINILIDEIKKALNNSFYIDSLNIKTKLDFVLAILSQHPTIEALNTFYSAFDGERKVILLTPDKIAELVWKYRVYI